MRVKALLFVSVALCSGEVPQLPRVYVDTTYKAPKGPVIKVNADANLQAVFDSAAPGSVITLQPGAVFTGNFTLSEKSGWVYVTTAGFDVRPGNRVTPADAPKMARLQTGNALPVIKAPKGASFWRFIGIEIVNSSRPLDVISLIQLQPDTLQDFNSAADYPHHIIFDRCYVHENADDRIRRAFRLAGAHFAIVDSDVRGIIFRGFDAQTISGSQGTGPYKIVNNYLEASTEIVAFGGSNVRVPGEILADIEIRGNHLYKNPEWKNIAKDPKRGAPLFKNCIEFKHGLRIVIEGNICEENWAQAQVGFAIVMTPVYWKNLVNPDGTPAYAIEDVTFRNNIIKNTALAINLLGTGIQTRDGDRSPSRRQLYDNNIWEVYGAGGGGRIFQITSNPTDVTISRQLVKYTGDSPCLGTSVFMGATTTEVTLKDNVLPSCSYGIASRTGMSTKVKWEAVFGPAETLSERVAGNTLYGPKRPAYLPPGNKFVADVGSADRIIDQAAIDAATKHARDGKTAGERDASAR